jgi:hypothetical protein
MYITRALIGRNPCLDQDIQTRKKCMGVNNIRGCLNTISWEKIHAHLGE